MIEPITAPPMLAYADLPAQMGIQYEVRDGQVKIVLPPAPWWQRGEVIAPLLVIPLFSAYNLGIGIWRRDTAQILMSGVLTLGLVISGLVTMKLRRPLKLVLNHATLQLENIRPLFSADTPVERTFTFPREAVYDVHFVPQTGNLIVRIHGREMIEIKPSTNRQIVEWIAAELRRALGLPA